MAWPQLELRSRQTVIRFPRTSHRAPIQKRMCVSFETRRTFMCWIKRNFSVSQVHLSFLRGCFMKRSRVYPSIGVLFASLCLFQVAPNVAAAPITQQEAHSRAEAQLKQMTTE